MVDTLDNSAAVLKSLESVLPTRLTTRSVSLKEKLAAIEAEIRAADNLVGIQLLSAPEVVSREYPYIIEYPYVRRELFFSLEAYLGVLAEEAFTIRRDEFGKQVVEIKIQPLVVGKTNNGPSFGSVPRVDFYLSPRVEAYPEQGFYFIPGVRYLPQHDGTLTIQISARQINCSAGQNGHKIFHYGQELFDVFKIAGFDGKHNAEANQKKYGRTPEPEFQDLLREARTPAGTMIKGPLESIVDLYKRHNNRREKKTEVLAATS